MKKQWIFVMIAIVLIIVIAVLYIIFLMPISPPQASWVCTPASMDWYCVISNLRRNMLAWYDTCTLYFTQADLCYNYPTDPSCVGTHTFKCGCQGVDTFTNCNSGTTDCNIRRGTTSSTDYAHITGYGTTYSFSGSYNWAIDAYHCVALPWDFTLSCNPTVANNVKQGTSASTTVSIAPNGGTPASSVVVTLSSIPSGWTTNWGLNTYTCAAGSSCAPTLTITTSAFTSPGSYIIGVSGTGGGKTRSDGFQINLIAACTNACSYSGYKCSGTTCQQCSDTNGDGCTELTNVADDYCCAGASYCSASVCYTPPAFDFSIGASPTSGTVAQTGSIQTTVSLGLTSGTTQSVSLSCSGAPSGGSCIMFPTSCSPPCTSTATLSTSSSPTGSYSITITGTGGQTHSTTYGLTVGSISGNLDLIFLGIVAAASIITLVIIAAHFLGFL